MNRTFLLIVTTALLLAARSPSFAGNPPSTPGPDTAPLAAADLDALEQAARAEATESLARLELIQARQALRDEQYESAARKARSALELLQQVPPNRDVSVFELQAEGILARAGRLGADAAPSHPAVQADAHAAARSRPPDVSAPPDWRVQYQARLEAAYRDSEARALVEAHAARVIPPRVVTYPDDWLEIVEKRSPCASGLVARTPGWRDDQGREWYTALYDIHDIIRMPANFAPPVSHPAWSAIAADDRNALRQSSYIFRGSADDLAAGVPLLRYFGGVYDADQRSGYSKAEFDRVIRLIEAFSEPPAQTPRVVPLAP